MRLLIDIGNTRIKWAFADNGKLSASGVYALRQDGELDANGIASLPHQWQHTPTSAFVVNVAGSAAETALREMLIQQFAIDLQRVRTTERCGAVVNGYRSAAQLGTDRWAAIVAAWNLYGSPVCVIDAGTATTIDAVGDDGRHLGGIIVPGLTLMQAALQRDTSDIDRHIRQSDGHKTERGWYGRETKAAVEQGVAFMFFVLTLRAKLF
jgi:type III pantothenate kinase